MKKDIYPFYSRYNKSTLWFISVRTQDILYCRLFWIIITWFQSWVCISLEIHKTNDCKCKQIQGIPQKWNWMMVGFLLQHVNHVKWVSLLSPYQNILNFTKVITETFNRDGEIIAQMFIQSLIMRRDFFNIFY